MQQFVQRHQKLQAAMKHGWVSFIQAARPHRALHQVMPAPGPMIDPVALTMLAVNRLGPATLRTATNGKALTVAVPDTRTADIFRAALYEMQKTRRTDRLVAVVVTEESGRGKRGRDVAEC
jgi:arginine deiminase